MRLIRKGGEPACLGAHRRAEAAFYGNLSAACRAEVIEAILREQGALCAYCMCRIRANTTSIEHHRAGHGDDDADALTWLNLLGVCPGGEGLPRAGQTCDTRRGDAPLAIDPQRDAHMRWVSYGNDGTLTSSDPGHQREIDDTLNLNLLRLKRARTAALSSAIEAWSRLGGGGRWSTAFIAQALESLRGRVELPEYLGIVEHYAERRLAKD